MKIDELYQQFKSSNGVSIDSRTIQANQIFFAITGENFDGHNYVSNVLENGARAAVIDNSEFHIQGKTILVESVLECLQSLANFHRRNFKGPVLAITGSNGKTSTKELTYSVLAKKYKVHYTKGNLNNHLGVPMTLLEADLDSDFLIIEMGANHIGEIHDLCHITEPTHGLITNIGRAHLEGFGSFEGVIKAKTELYHYLSHNGGSIIYNQDDHILTSNLSKDVSSYPYEVNDIEFLYQAPTLGFIDLETAETYQTKLFGIYNQTNIEAAITIGRIFKVLDEDIFDALEAYVPKMNRSQIQKFGETTFIKDAYNANPSSMKLSIKSVMNLQTQRKSLILGDMKELGKDEIEMHNEILEYICQGKWNAVILVGSIFPKAKLAQTYVTYEDVDALIDDFSNVKDSINGSSVLLKGSRSMKLEKVVELYN